MTKKATKEFRSRIAELGCIVDVEVDGCVRMCGSPPHLHHVTNGTMSKKGDKLLPLCPIHHQHGGFGVAFHAGKETWEKKFGTQEELLIKRDKLLGELWTQ